MLQYIKITIITFIFGFIVACSCNGGGVGSSSGDITPDANLTITATNFLNNVPINQIAYSVITFKNDSAFDVYNMTIPSITSDTNDLNWDNTFTSTSKCVSGASIPAYGSCVLRLIYAPEIIENKQLKLTASINNSSDISRTKTENFDMVFVYSSIDNSLPHIPHIVISANPNSFSNVAISQLESAVVTFSNMSVQTITNLTINDINVQNSDFRWDSTYDSSDKCQTVGLAPKSSCTLNLIYQPTKHESGQLIIGGEATFLAPERSVVFALTPLLFDFTYTNNTPNIQVSTFDDQVYSIFPNGGRYNFITYTNSSVTPISNIQLSNIKIQNPEFYWTKYIPPYYPDHYPCESGTILYQNQSCTINLGYTPIQVESMTFTATGNTAQYTDSSGIVQTFMLPVQPFHIRVFQSPLLTITSNPYNPDPATGISYESTDYKTKLYDVIHLINDRLDIPILGISIESSQFKNDGMTIFNCTYEPNPPPGLLTAKLCVESQPLAVGESCDYPFSVYAAQSTSPPHQYSIPNMCFFTITASVGHLLSENKDEFFTVNVW